MSCLGSKFNQPPKLTKQFDVQTQFLILAISQKVREQLVTSVCMKSKNAFYGL